MHGFAPTEAALHVARARLDVARRLLADPAASLGDVAFRRRAFKWWTGMPPGQWRRS